MPETLLPAVPAPAVAPRASRRPRVLVLSSSLLTDRMLRFSSFAARAAEGTCEIVCWSTAAGADDAPFATEPFPAFTAWPEVPHALLRHLNDRAWDATLRDPSRASMWRHVRRRELPLWLRALTLPGHAIAAVGAQQALEDGLHALLRRHERSPEATARLRRLAPDLVVTTGPHRHEEPGIVGAAQRLGIPVMALPTSWDNLSTKGRMPCAHDAYAVWSPRMRDELHAYYPRSREVPVHVVGAPQFDVFHAPAHAESRAAFCAREGLDPAKPIVLHVLGSPNFLHEHHAALALAERVEAGALGDVQLLVRPHPLFARGDEATPFARFGPRVRLQGSRLATRPKSERALDADDVSAWVGTFRHAAVLVNLASTCTIDAALCDVPVVNIDFDPAPGGARDALVHDVNHRWTHFRPIAGSGAVVNVRTVAELVEAVRGALADPARGREARAAVAAYVCGHVDGRSGARLHDAIADVAARAAAGALRAAR